MSTHPSINYMPSIVETSKPILQDGSIVQDSYDSVETGPLVNLLACEGKRGKVSSSFNHLYLNISALNYTRCLRSRPKVELEMTTLLVV